MLVTVAGILIIVLLLGVGLASAARIIASRRGLWLQVVIDIECEALPHGRGWRATADAAPGVDCIGTTKTQAVGRAVIEAGKRLSLGVYP